MKSVPFALVLGTVLASCNARPQTSPASGLSESWDRANRPQILGLKTLSYDELVRPGADQGASAKKPWRDSYWPYHRKNIAYRYTTSTDFATAADQIASAQAMVQDASLSPAEKYDVIAEDPTFALTAESWAIYDYYSRKYPDDVPSWSWMGICAGWAPASLAEPAPVSTVLAVNAQGLEVVFFAGDVRGLLSKAYDINATEGGIRMVGSRCNDADHAIVRDHQGRAVDGQLTASHAPFTILSDYSRVNGAMQVTRDPLAPAPYWLLSTEPLTSLSGPAKMWTYASREDLALDLESGRRGERADVGGQVDVQLYKGCRDVNPASLHATLVQVLADSAPLKGQMVVEVSRGAEVWNHPVWGFQTKLGDPLSLAAEPQARRVFRAAETSHIVHVETDLVYIIEAQPRSNYAPEPEGGLDWDDFRSRPWTYSSLQLKYTLELDRTGLVIGGEWDEGANGRASTPDFFWRTIGNLTDRAKSGGASPLKYSLLRQLVACSIRAPDAVKDVVVDGSTETIPVVRCPLNPS